MVKNLLVAVAALGLLGAAWAADALRGAVAPPATPGAVRPVQRQRTTYDYQETAEDMLKEVRVVIPAGLPTVRGLLVVTNGAGGDTRDGYAAAWYREFLHLHDFAFLGAKGFTSHVESLQVMQHALVQIARDSGHGELVHVPYATTGFSAGGGFASRLLVEVPERVIACVPVSARLNFTGRTASAANLGTPACIISGELEEGFPKVVEPILAAYRPRGALFGWMTVQGGGHSKTDQDVFAMMFLDACVRLRYPADADVRQGPVKLEALDPNAGWVADHTTWKSGLTHIAPARQFQGAVEQSSWLPTEDLAFVYRAYATYDRPLRIASPADPRNGRQVWAPGASPTIQVDDSQFAGWKKLEFYDGARKLGELTHGPAQFTATNLGIGFHGFSVLGTDGQGRLRPSNPVLVVVGKPPVVPSAPAGE